MKSPLICLRVLRTAYFAVPLTLISVALFAFLLLPVTRLAIESGVEVGILTRPLVFGVALLAYGYGLLRGWFFHPVFDAGYRKWLANSPWTPGQPLPKGPLRLDWTDLIVVGVLSAVAFFLALTIEPPNWVYVLAPAIVFAIALTFIWTAANWSVGQNAYVHAVVWVPALCFLLEVPLIVFLVCPFIMAGIAWLGVHRSLAVFPWSESGLAVNRIRSLKQARLVVGWPYRELLQPAREFRTTLGAAAMEAALVAVWIWLPTQFLPAEDLPGAALYFAAGAGFMACWRTAAYGSVICGNVCFGQRVANKQGIIWRHDRILLAPLLMLVIGVAMPWTLYSRFGISAGLSFAMSAGLVVLIGRGMGPSIEQLQYAGVHSRFGTLLQKKDFVTSGSKA